MAWTFRYEGNLPPTIVSLAAAIPAGDRLLYAQIVTLPDNVPRPYVKISPFSPSGALGFGFSPPVRVYYPERLLVRQASIWPVEAEASFQLEFFRLYNPGTSTLRLRVFTGEP